MVVESFINIIHKAYIYINKPLPNLEYKDVLGEENEKDRI